MKETETGEIEKALQHEREIEPSKFDALADNHAQLAKVSAGIAHLNSEWARLQAEQAVIVRGIHDGGS